MALLGSWTVDLLVAVSVLFGVLYYVLTSTHNTWKKKKVPYIKPSFPFGNFNRALFRNMTFREVFAEFYKELKPHAFGGVYNARTPIFVPCDPEIVKRILTKDFSSFHDRGVPFDEKNDPISANLFNLPGARWKAVRAKLSPTFTSGKIKGMFPLVEECTEELRECIQEEMKKKGGSVEMEDLLIRFTTDVIGTCAFGIKCNSLKDPSSEFYRKSRGVFKNNTPHILRFLAAALGRKFSRKIFAFKNMFAEITTFFTNLMAETVKFRKDNNVQRNDFVDLMMKAVDADGSHISQDVMTAQAFLFFLAGLDNVAHNIGFCVHAMAIDPSLQERLYQEVRSVLEEHNGKMSYEALSKMDLVARTLDEGLRLYTPAGVLLRIQTEDKYVVPGTDITLEKGTSVMIPAQAIHHDEKHYPNPTKFDPDRFTEEEKQKRHPYAYIPFGEGPRICIASRFAHFEMRLCLAELVRHFHFSVAPETDVALELDRKSNTPTPKRGFWVRVSERNHE